MFPFLWSLPIEARGEPGIDSSALNSSIHFFLFFSNLYPTGLGRLRKGEINKLLNYGKKNLKLQAVTVDDSARNTRKNAAKCDNQGELQNSVTLYSSNATGALESFRALEGVLGRAPLYSSIPINQLGIIPLFLFKKKVTSGSQFEHLNR